jgi:Spy/CpxP family protein refolding chaperone
MTDPRPSWRHPKILFVLLTVFLCGAAAGALVARVAVPVRAAAPVWKEGGRERTLDLMRKELALTPEQAAKIETVLDDMVMYYQNLQDQMDDFRADGKRRIMALLTPEQQKEFKKMMNSLSAKLR